MIKHILIAVTTALLVLPNLSSTILADPPEVPYDAGTHRPRTATSWPTPKVSASSILDRPADRLQRFQPRCGATEVRLSSPAIQAALSRRFGLAVPLAVR